jgi:RND superfamily putative drug exporter
VSSFLYRLGRAAVRCRVVVLAAWIIVLALIGGAALLGGKSLDDTFSIPGSPSQQALDHLKHVFPQVSGIQAQLVVTVPDGHRVDTAAAREAVTDAAHRIEKVDQVTAVANPFTPMVHDAISHDHRAALVAVTLDAQQGSVQPKTRSSLVDVAHDLAAKIGPGTQVHTGGDAFADNIPKFSITEVIGMVVALVVLLLVFRSFLAAGMPLVTAVLGVGISTALILGATMFFPVSSTAPLLAVMIGLAVGIDYALFILSRHRDQLAEGLEVEESVARATATAGSAVIFAGMTVIIALVGLFVAGIPFLTMMGTGAAFAVAFAVLIAITLVPALLGFCGERLRPKRKRKPKARRRPRKRLSTRWVRLVTKVPALTVVIVVAGLAVVAIPTTDLRLSLPDNGSQEVGSPSRETYDVIGEHFGPGFNAPLIVTADIVASHDPIGVTNGIADKIKALPGVAAVPLATPNAGADTGIIQVYPSSAGDSPQTKALVAKIRALHDPVQKQYGSAIAVTGLTAIGIDVSDQLGSALLPFGILVVGLSLVLLAMVFRSIWVPIKATAGYLLSIGAAFGATSFVFQQGHLAGPLNVSHTGSVISFLPILLMGVLFGLAMDYEVFLVSRIREDYVRTGDPHGAIESGFVSASKVVVAAAVIMFAVFAAFVPEGTSTIKPIAFSLAVGVFVDAFLVRMTLVPAVLAMLGRRAWWLPRRLDRKLPVFDAEGDALVHELRLAEWPAPDSTEVISARALRVGDDRDDTVFENVDVHLPRGGLLAIHGSGPTGKTALLYTFAGRIGRVDGDLKVLGSVVPQHAHAVRRKVALIPCRETEDPVSDVRAALADGVELVLIDDLDTVVNTAQRVALCQIFAGGIGSFVLSCQSTELLHDVLPRERATTLDMSAEAKRFEVV